MEEDETPRHLRQLMYFPPTVSNDELEAVAESDYPNEFTWTNSFDVDLVGRFMYHGYLTMAMSGVSNASSKGGTGGINIGKYVLTPKIHHERCLIFFSKIHIPKNIEKKKSKEFEISIDKSFDDVIDGIHEQHGENWFYEPLVDSFRIMSERGENGVYDGRVRFHSIEIWNDGKLVAGEVGYVCGAVYTSLSGFSRMDSAGTVQMLLMAKLFEQKGLILWDLGMSLKYKRENLGGMTVPRKIFIGMLRKLRDNKIPHVTLDSYVPAVSAPASVSSSASKTGVALGPRINCKELFQLLKEESIATSSSTKIDSFPIVFAFLSGIFASLTSIIAKMFSPLSAAFPRREIGLLGIVLSNLIMIRFFVKALGSEEKKGTSSTVVIILINTFTNIFISSVAGYLLFNEFPNGLENNKRWVLGATLSFLGIACFVLADIAPPTSEKKDQ